ncbi:hypothetical protein J6590_078198 [Homalodisca vitripennis]|nr:hypothetical protein J6590_078198 [Homalodisca vitripennis]
MDKISYKAPNTLLLLTAYSVHGIHFEILLVLEQYFDSDIIISYDYIVVQLKIPYEILLAPILHSKVGDTHTHMPTPRPTRESALHHTVPSKFKLSVTVLTCVDLQVENCAAIRLTCQARHLEQQSSIQLTTYPRSAYGILRAPEPHLTWMTDSGIVCLCLNKIKHLANITQQCAKTIHVEYYNPILMENTLSLAVTRGFTRGHRGHIGFKLTSNTLEFTSVTIMTNIPTF